MTHHDTFTEPEILTGSSERVREILSYYPSESPSVKTRLARLLGHGRLAGTGKLVILPVVKRRRRWSLCGGWV